MAQQNTEFKMNLHDDTVDHSGHFCAKYEPRNVLTPHLPPRLPLPAPPVLCDIIKDQPLLRFYIQTIVGTRDGDVYYGWNANWANGATTRVGVPGWRHPDSKQGKAARARVTYSEGSQCKDYSVAFSVLVKVMADGYANCPVYTLKDAVAAVPPAPPLSADAVDDLLWVTNATRQHIRIFQHVPDRASMADLLELLCAANHMGHWAGMSEYASPFDEYCRVASVRYVILWRIWNRVQLDNPQVPDAPALAEATVARFHREDRIRAAAAAAESPDMDLYLELDSPPAAALEAELPPVVLLGRRAPQQREIHNDLQDVRPEKRVKRSAVEDDA